VGDVCRIVETLLDSVVHRESWSYPPFTTSIANTRTHGHNLVPTLYLSETLVSSGAKQAKIPVSRDGMPIHFRSCTQQGVHNITRDSDM
jgi:hypothetical protein